MILLLLACGGGPSDETLFSALQVVAVVAEPPEIAPGETTTLTPTITDPAGVGPEVMLWTCTVAEDGCAEAVIPGQGVTIGAAGETPTAAYYAPKELAVAFTDPTLVLPVITWTLACVPGVCPLFDAVRAEPAPGSAEAASLSEQLADPTAFMDEVPLGEASLTLQTFGISVRDERVTNPVFTSAPEPDWSGAPGEEIPLEFTVESPDVVTAWGYATAGGFTEPSVEVEDGLVTLTAVAPDPAATGELFVVLTGEEGGSAVWRGTITSE